MSLLDVEMIRELGKFITSVYCEPNFKRIYTLLTAFYIQLQNWHKSYIAIVSGSAQIEQSFT